MRRQSVSARTQRSQSTLAVVLAAEDELSRPARHQSSAAESKTFEIE